MGLMTVFHVSTRTYAEGSVPSAEYSRAGVVWCFLARPDAEEYARAYRNEDGPGYLWRGKVDLTRASVRRVTGGDEECDRGYYEDVVLDAIRSGADVACHVDGIVALAASAQVTWELLGRVAPDPHRDP